MSKQLSNQLLLNLDQETRKTTVHIAQNDLNTRFKFIIYFEKLYHLNFQISVFNMILYYVYFLKLMYITFVIDT